ncbi:MAG TPA: magnesium transporter [Firmicutes bacterium]|jgi:magnesium transporter|nr:magnesium transporter [Bacillota bacterium]HAW70941.1 magnesium transporter [Bacillota bacterium]HAZ22477.1 magnesium transporter [Bacillota bacterium]HBE06198.1 magnesium transporter [Bacillota bacterium]HBR24033.1 magnesium transporter [Bacillota bacterium]
MLRVFLSVNDDLTQVDDICTKGTWISLVNPSEEELETVRKATGADPDFLKAPLDPEERSRIESDEGQVLIIINVPIMLNDSSTVLYDTIPFGIIVTNDNFITVCLKQNPLLDELVETRLRGLNTKKRTRFLLQLLFKTATQYLRDLRQIDKQTDEVEKKLHRSMKNEELIKLLSLEKSLVYFNTSLRSNEYVMEKLLRSRLMRIDPEAIETSQVLQMYPDDEELLEDVIIENKQAMEMCQIHSDILSSMMDAFASVISNNVNIVMKFLTSVTIVLSIPTMVSSFFGMNVPLPFDKTPFAFSIIMLISFGISGTVAYLMARRKMF